MTATRTITLHQTGGQWAATHSDPRVVDLFGTATLPTAWLSSVPAAVVLVAIRLLNPDAQVTLA